MANSLLHPVYPHDIPISDGYAIHETSQTTSLLNHEPWNFQEAIPQAAPAPGHPGLSGAARHVSTDPEALGEVHWRRAAPTAAGAEEALRGQAADDAPEPRRLGA